MFLLKSRESVDKIYLKVINNNKSYKFDEVECHT